LRTDRFPTLVAHVLEVFRLQGQKQMGGIYTWRVVAPVTHTHPRWNRTVSEEPRDAVCTKNVPRTANAELSVAMRFAVSCPLPAGKPRSAINLSPKPRNRLATQRRNDKMCFRHGSLQHRGLCLERRAA
jgi:hypothetical protein